MWGHTGAPMLHVGISYSFEKKRLFIVDHQAITVYQVKCKLVVLDIKQQMRRKYHGGLEIPEPEKAAGIEIVLSQNMFFLRRNCERSLVLKFLFLHVHICYESLRKETSETLRDNHPGVIKNS